MNYWPTIWLLASLLRAPSGQAQTPLVLPLLSVPIRGADFIVARSPDSAAQAYAQARAVLRRQGYHLDRADSVLLTCTTTSRALGSGVFTSCASPCARKLLAAPFGYKAFI